jgi:uncharacterized protein
MAATIPTNRVGGGTSRSGQPPLFWIFPANAGELLNFIRSGWVGLCICRLRCRRLMKRNTRTILAGGLLAVGTFAFAEAGQLEAGEAAFFKHDYANAIRLLRPLADSGNTPAQNRLASIYFWGGHGVQQDATQAALWYRKAAERGNALAQAHLGLMFEHGYGVPRNAVMARMWLNLAVARAPSLSMAVKLRSEVAAQMTPAQIAEAKRLAEEWEPK